MKKIKFLKVAGLFILLLTLLLITGCEDQNDQPNPFANTYLVTSSTSKGGTIDPIGSTYVQKGDSIIYKIIPDSAHSIFTIKVDGIELPDVTNTLKIIATKNETVEVEFIQNRALLLIGEPWLMKGLKYFYIETGEMVADLILNEEQLTNKFYFYSNKQAEIFTSSGKLISNGSWTLSEDETHLLMGGDYKIVTLTKNEFVIDIDKDSNGQPPLYNGKPAIFRQEYYRP